MNQTKFRFKKNPSLIGIPIFVLIKVLIFYFLSSSSYASFKKIELSTLDSYLAFCPEIQKQERRPISYIFPKIKEEEKLAAINSIKQKDKVKDACITQDCENINLSLTVDYKTSKERARELGENFIRLVKINSTDINPEEKIGIGFYNYVISVLYPDRQEVVRGTKACNTESIAWEKGR